MKQRFLDNIARSTMVVAMVVALFIAPLIVLAQGGADDRPIVVDDATCQQRVSLLNYRSQLLTTYRDSEVQDYTSFRKAWEKRIPYASQWIKQDAEKARSTLYEMDRAHKVLVSEINKQIDEYRPFETAPLDCSEGKRQELIQRLEAARGTQNGKAVGGHALIKEKRVEFAEIKNRKFEPTSKALVKKLNAIKLKKPQSTEVAIEVVKY